MILLADSGSTKCDWRVLDDKKKVIFDYSTIGFNPLFHTTDFIETELGKSTDLIAFGDKITNLYFYGAACSSEERRSVVSNALKKYFPKAEIIVRNDLQGAALASCDDKPGIVCIIGTGSNAAWFDGKELHEELHSLGWILGDEGSGAYFGKRILADFVYGNLPPQIEEELKKDFGLNREVILENVYRKPHANVYLASFAKYLSKHRQYYYVSKLMQFGFNEFLEVHVCHYENFMKVPVHFIGSMAHFFEDDLREVCSKKGITIGKIMQQPIIGLTEYFSKKVLA